MFRDVVRRLCLHCVSKNAPFFCHCPFPLSLPDIILTDFQFFFTGTFRIQFAITWLLNDGMMRDLHGKSGREAAR